MWPAEVGWRRTPPKRYDLKFNSEEEVLNMEEETINEEINLELGLEYDILDNIKLILNITEDNAQSIINDNNITSVDDLLVIEEIL